MYCMHRLLLFILVVTCFLVCRNVSAQDTIVLPHPTKAYVNFAGGINTCNGLGGVQVEYFVGKQVSVFGAGGIGTWGLKMGAGTRLYMYDHAGPALAVSYATASGLQQLKLQEVQVINAQGIPEIRSVDLELFRLHTINISVLEMFPMGKKHNRFFLEAGYSIALQGKKDTNYRVLEPLILNETTKQALRLLQPGGLMLSMGFSFPF